MPLSEQEQKILEEIERGLYQEDPSFAKDVRDRAPRMAERRRARLGSAAFVVGFGLLIAFFATGFVLVGVVAFGAMVWGIVLLAGSIRGVVSPRRPPGPKIADRVSGVVHGWEEKLRQRYKRP
ncbi:MAG: hypothetical protein QOH26_384 [Actinomycetota bacterium]|nr:hypothetical protein [Actinomycetota bacterium]